VEESRRASGCDEDQRRRRAAARAIASAIHAKRAPLPSPRAPASSHPQPPFSPVVPVPPPSPPPLEDDDELLDEDDEDDDVLPPAPPSLGEAQAPAKQEPRLHGVPSGLGG
jgi:hypothetical protein